MLPDNLYCPTLHTEIFIAVQDQEKLFLGDLARQLLKQNGLTRSDISESEYRALKLRISNSIKQNKRLNARVELINKNLHTIISKC